MEKRHAHGKARSYLKEKRVSGNKELETRERKLEEFKGIFKTHGTKRNGAEDGVAAVGIDKLLKPIEFLSSSRFFLYYRGSTSNMFSPWLRKCAKGQDENQL